MKNYRTILITGASSGIGRALAELYAAPGVTLLLTGRHADRLREAEEACRGKGAEVLSTTIDVTDRPRFERKILEWDDKHPVDLVIANAGISGGLDRENAAKFLEIMQINLDGTFNTIHPLIPRMTARRKGQIALMSSMAGFRGMPNAPAYSISKVAVRATGEALRPLLRKDGVTVSTIHPGFIRTPLTDVNTFPMPFLMSVEKAAGIIRAGLEKDRAVIAFPWQMHLLVRVLCLLPRGAADWILARAPRKG
jgi:short-subunit dehydrogenase